ncbi:MAG: hypothetical protein K2M20_02905 [Lachnospiraceae bacterium]|nr:hypothetical protein [Lachnospiraceae bacterium]
MWMENTERGGIPEILGTAGEGAAAGEGQQDNHSAGKNQKKKKTGKNRNGLKALLLLLQHAALAIMVFAVIVVTVCTTVRIKGVHSNGSYSYIRSADPGTPFEESDAFNYIFGYAVADVIRFGVVSSQMETKGAFDGNKMVDVTAYNYRNSGLPDEYVTAIYRLEDLLKWQSYGFTYNDVEMTRAEASAFLADTTQVTTIDPKSGYQNTTDASYLKSDVKGYTVVSGMAAGEENGERVVEAVGTDEDSGFVSGYQPAGALGDHAAEADTSDLVEVSPAVEVYDMNEEVYEYPVLVNRYKTAEGKNLEEYVSDWEQYYDLCHNVQKAAESLTYNYNEYAAYGEYYNVKNSNVRFLIEKTVGGETQYYSNMEAGSSYRKLVMQKMDTLASGKAETDISAEKFVYYSPADMVYRTNTTIAEETVRQMLQSYDYAYPESVRIWIGVDGSYQAQDAFTQGARYLPNLWLWVAAAFLAVLLYLLLFVCQTVMTGRVYDENGEKRIRLTAFDRIPTEGALLIAVGAVLMVLWMAVVLTALADIDPTDIDFYREAVHKEWFKVFLFIGVFVADVLFTFFFYSLVRRIKARTLWKNSWLCRLAKRLMKFAWKVYDNGGIVLRTWVPYGVFLAVNLVLLLWAVEVGNPLLVLFAGAIDLIVGILLYKDVKERQGIVEGIETITGGQVDHQIDTEELHGDNRTLAHSVNSIGKGIKEAVEISMKDERMKADLITNVSHDIKTPLTSIINYVDLIKREQVDNEKVQNYIRVLDEKSQRLKQLTDDLVEASKITSGNISLHFERINLTELMNQTIGEFSEKFDTKNLTTVMNVNTREAVIEADSRRIWRVMENLFNNVFKYAMPGTRVYVTLEKAARGAEEEADRIQVTIKNISENPLLCKPEELTERFIRGDESRTTEGSGLGLSIAQNLTLAQKGSFEIELDGDLFKVFLTFPVAT